MKFIQNLRETIDSDTKTYGSNVDRFMFKTGFMVFDYLNGFKEVYSDGTSDVGLGVDAGKIIQIIGKSGTGKSTLGLQIGTNIISKYDESSMFVLDFEQSNEPERIRAVTGISEEFLREKISIKKTGIYTNTVYQLVKQIHDLKLKHQKELMVDNAEGVLGDDGKPVKILPPTVVFCDSIAMMMPRPDGEIEDLQGNMTATAAARVNTQLFKRLVQPCVSANIICIFVNHITDDITTGIMPKAAAINYLKQGESLPGGKAAQYLTNTLIKLTAATKLDETKAYKIKGFEVKVELVKSRTAEAGKTATLVFNQLEGFDDELSIYHYLKQSGQVTGGGASYRIKGFEEVVFSQANLKEKLKENKEFRDYFYKLGEEMLELSMKESSRIEIQEDMSELDDEEVETLDE